MRKSHVQKKLQVHSQHFLFLLVKYLLHSSFFPLFSSLEFYRYFGEKRIDLF